MDIVDAMLLAREIEADDIGRTPGRDLNGDSRVDLADATAIADLAVRMETPEVTPWRE